MVALTKMRNLIHEKYHLEEIHLVSHSATVRRILWSPLSKVQLFRKIVLLLPFVLFSLIQSKYVIKSLQMKFTFNIGKKLNSIVWLFGI